MSAEHREETIVANVKARVASKPGLRRQDIRNMVRHALIYARITPTEETVDQYLAKVLQ